MEGIPAYPVFLPSVAVVLEWPSMFVYTRSQHQSVMCLILVLIGAFGPDGKSPDEESVRWPV